MTKKMNIVIIGLGNIGSYFYNYLKKIKILYLIKLILFQIYFMFQQKLYVKKEILRSQKNYG